MPIVPFLLVLVTACAAASESPGISVGSGSGWGNSPSSGNGGGNMAVVPAAPPIQGGSGSSPALPRPATGRSGASLPSAPSTAIQPSAPANPEYPRPANHSGPRFIPPTATASSSGVQAKRIEDSERSEAWLVAEAEGLPLPGSAREASRLLDENQDQYLSADEIAASTSVGLAMHVRLFDSDGDAALSPQEMRRAESGWKALMYVGR